MRAYSFVRWWVYLCLASFQVKHFECVQLPVPLLLDQMNQYLNLVIYNQYPDELTRLSNNEAWDQGSHLGLCKKEYSKPVGC